MRRWTIPVSDIDLFERNHPLDANCYLETARGYRFFCVIGSKKFYYCFDRRAWIQCNIKGLSLEVLSNEIYFKLLRIVSERCWIRKKYENPLPFFNNSEFTPLLICMGREDNRGAGTVTEGGWQDGKFWFGGQIANNVKAWRMLPSLPEDY